LPARHHFCRPAADCRSRSLPAGSPGSLLDYLVHWILSATLLPLGIRVLATTALGDKVEDRTLQYLALKPVSRFAIVLQKFIAIVTVCVPVVFAGVAIMWGVLSFGEVDGMRDLLWPALAASLVSIMGFGALFLLVSLVIQRVLILGVVYVFVWETALSRYLPGINAISIRHFSQSLFVRLVEDRRITLDNASAQSTVLITTAGIAVVCLALATWRLRAMSLE
jgi:ABC-2 type transport system permease protein